MKLIKFTPPIELRSFYGSSRVFVSFWIWGMRKVLEIRFHLLDRSLMLTLWSSWTFKKIPYNWGRWRVRKQTCLPGTLWDLQVIEVKWRVAAILLISIVFFFLVYFWIWDWDMRKVLRETRLFLNVSSFGILKCPIGSFGFLSVFQA